MRIAEKSSKRFWLKSTQPKIWNSGSLLTDTGNNFRIFWAKIEPVEGAVARTGPQLRLFKNNFYTKHDLFQFS